MNKLKVELLPRHPSHLNELESLLSVDQAVWVDLISGPDAFVLSSQEKDPSIWDQNWSWEVWYLEGNDQIYEGVFLGGDVVEVEFCLVPLEPMDDLWNSNVGRVQSDSIEGELDWSVQRSLDLLKYDLLFNYDLFW